MCMTVSEASQKWNLTKKEVYGICQYYGFPKKGIRGSYQIPSETVPVLIPDKRYLRNPLRCYLFACEAIEKKLTIVYDLIHTEADEVKTAVRELKSKNLIILIEGREDDLDYKNYMLGIEFRDWRTRNTKGKVELLNSLLSTVIEAGTEGVVTALIKARAVG